MRRLRNLGRRGRLVTAAFVVLVLAGITLTAVATRSSPVRQQDLRVAGTPEKDGAPVSLDATVFLPAHTPAPAVLLAHGFGGSKSDLVGQAQGLARNGFVVLTYTARGFGRSGGSIHLDSPDYEVADGRRLIDYLAASPDVAEARDGGPLVGVAGSSYGGGLALLLAGSDPRIKAVAADITWNDLNSALFPGGVFKKLWAGVLFQEGLTTSGPCGRFAADVCAAYQQASETGTPNATLKALLSASSPAGVLSRITAPTLLTQGQQDSLFPLDQAEANAAGIAAAGTPVQMVWRSGGHDAGSDNGGAPALVTSWFETVLKRQGTPRTPFRLAQLNSALSASTGRRVDQTLVVAGGYRGAQHDVAETVTGDPVTIQAPAGGNPAAVSGLPGLGSVFDLAASAGAANPLSGLSAVQGQSVSFTGAPLSSSLLVAGSSRVRLTITATSTTDATLFASLRDVSADGTNTLPASLVAPLRLTGLTPGRPTTVTVDLPGIVRSIAAGHRLRVTVSTTDLAYQLPVDPRSYRIALAADTLSVPTVDARVVRSGTPAAWLAVGVVVALLLGALGAVSALRRRRVRDDPALAEVPISVSGLVKEYGDGYRAVDGIDFQVQKGQVVGLLGPNGAGKTTTLRMLVGLISPTQGQIHVFGSPVVPGAAVLSRLGAFIEGPGFLPHLSGRDNLRLYWGASGRPEADAAFDTALQIAGLGASIDRRVKTYSQGMRQRLAIAQAMLGLPELLVLDEPTNGLDPPQIAEMREVLRGYADTGRTVVVSSHLLAEVEQTCTHVVVMHKGRLIAAGSVAEVAGDGAMQLVVPDAGRAQAVLAAAGIGASVVPARRALEDVFLSLIGEDS